MFNFLINLFLNSFCCSFSLLALSSVLTLTLNKKIGINALYFNIFLHFLALLLITLLLIDLYQTNLLIFINYGNWFESDDITITWSFIFDTLSISMAFVVTFVSFLVHLFSYIYMKNDPNINKFFGFLSLFSFFMLILVLSSNFIVFFLGWEGIGLLSYLLINFWNSRAEANRSSLKAVLMNRIGDLFFYIFLSLLFVYFKSFDFFECQLIVPDLYFTTLDLKIFSINLIDLLSFCLLIGAVAKSSQFGLHMWLPDAMEGPTPVSALLHAATMVTAGVYLIMRSTWLIEFSPLIINIMFLLACLTNLLISLVGIFQHDIKKIIAYSTTTQLSYMFIACLLSEYTLSFFHLFNHAFFKASLFLTAGIIIHYASNRQDISFYKFLTNMKTLFYIYFFVGLLSLSGLPFFAGYYSKDFIIEFSLLSFNFSFNYLINLILILSVLFTAFYSFLLLNTLFWNINHYYLKSQKLHKYAVEFNYFLLVPTTLLSFGALISGYTFSIIYNNVDDTYFNDIFYFNLSYNMLYMSHFNNFNDFNILYFGSLGCLLGYYFDYFLQFYLIPFKKDIILYINFYVRKLLSDLMLFYNFSFLSKTLYDIIWKYTDKYFLEYNNSFKLIVFVKDLAIKANSYQHGSIFLHFFITLLVLVFFDWISFLINILSVFFIYLYIYFLILFNMRKS